LALVLGSGFSPVAQALENPCEIAYDELPGFPRSTVSGHAGTLLIGLLAKTPVMVLNGRAHFYEGYDLSEVTFPIRVLAACQIRDLLLTNAAGGVSPRLHVGDFMVLRDHINLMGANPLRGMVRGDRSSFVDLRRAYDPALSRMLNQAGKEAGLKLRTGVYLAVSGPSYETPAEIRAFARLGADAVGMSTVPEVIVARYYGLRVAALSCITNLAAGRTDHPVSHAEVLATGFRVQDSALALLRKFAQRYRLRRGARKKAPALSD